MKSPQVVAFIGLGIMGSPMARNLLKAGFEVTLYSRTAQKAEQLAKNGGRVADSIAAATADAQVVITMLPDSPDVEAVLLGDGGVLQSVEPGTIVVDMSTIQPAVSRMLAARGATQGIHVLDAPVSGGEAGAIAGSLSIMVGGDPTAFEAVLPIFEAMGSRITHLGDPGSGQIVKAANQLIVAITVGAVAEALVLLEAMEVDTAAAVKVLSAGLAGSNVLDQKAGKMRTSDYTPGFRIALHHKDMGIAMGMARDAGVATPLGSVASQQMASMVAQGHGGLDHSGVKLLVDQLSGRP